MKIMTITLLAFLVAISTSFPCIGQSKTSQDRRVVGNTIVSDKLPKIKVEVAKGFKYLGRFDFIIGEIASGERFVFVDASANKKVKRLFIAQFEQILPTSDEIYRYSFEKAKQIGEHRFRQNTFAFSGAEAKRENPKGEAALTAEFLAAKGYKLEDELMLSRFLTVPDAEKKHEMILFYIENISTTRKRLSDLYVGDEESAIWKTLSRGLTDRSSRAFSIK